jgi:hypothetical protein
MAIKIISTPASAIDYDLGHVAIDLTRKTAVLIRQSKKKADKDHYESRLLQENLVPIAMKLRGETDITNILVFDEGAGISGTKGYDERKKLSELYLAIANDIVGSVVVARADRLFRDKHFLNVGMFTELAERKHLILIVPGRCVYDFTNYNDLKAFQKDMQDAYNYVATHVKYMNEARDQKMLRGLYGGSSLPAPYVIDRNAWKDEQAPVIYKPWLEPAIDLFKRFQAYDFSIAHLCRYIESLPYLFSLPSFEDTQRYMFRTQMRLVTGGYTFSHVSTVSYYLSNLTLGGYAKIGKDEQGNTLLIPNAFEAAIPFELLDLAYAAITGHHIDGTPFEGTKNTRRYMRRNPQGANALLHGVLTSGQGHVSVMPTADWEKNGYEYRCFKGLQDEEHPLKIMSGLVKTEQWWSLSSRALDRIVFDRLCDLAKHDTGLADRVKAFFESRKGQGLDESNLLTKQIKQTQERISRLDFLLTTPGIPLDIPTATKYALELADLNEKLPRLLRKQQAQSTIDPGEIITNFYHVLAHLSTEFKAQSIDVQKQMMSRLINQVTVNNISPHLFHLYIVWLDGIATRPDVALIWRGIAIKDLDGWSEEEDALLRLLYPKASQLEIMRSLPMRTWCRIYGRAPELGVSRDTACFGRKKVNEYYHTMSYADLDAAMQYAENGEDKAYVCDVLNKLAENTAKGEMNAYWPLPVDIVGFSNFISNCESRPRPGQQWQLRVSE